MCILLTSCAARVSDGWVSCDVLNVIEVEDSSSLTRIELVEIAENKIVIEKFCGGR
ncbi:hypothetical protein NVP1135O_42 [Vibrio phage 1.135.O._10N.222.54.B6]|nr:hypothetical protein NVP1135O_42 [Vibrio phage 1.135.O._10N.222.54.B6]